MGLGTRLAYISGAVLSFTHKLDIVLNSTFSEAAAEKLISVQEENMKRTTFIVFAVPTSTISEGVSACIRIRLLETMIRQSLKNYSSQKC